MRVGFPGGPRLEWYDRNPQSIENFYEATDVAPHAGTVRWSYTVPTGKKFFLENAMCSVHRKTAAGPSEIALVRVLARGYPLLKAKILTNTVGDFDHLNVGRSVVMQAGEDLVGGTSDSSTGGTCDYAVLAHGIEFDA